MQSMTIQEFADYCEHATITQSVDHGFAVVHTGRNALGQRFVAINDWHGRTVVTEAE